MSENVQMPALGESVTEGTVTRWLKTVGEHVGVDEPLLEVSTDKVDTEIPSPVAGVVQQILVGEDETVEVGTVLAIVGDGEPGSEPVPTTHETPQVAAAATPSAAPVAADTNTSAGTSSTPDAAAPVPAAPADGQSSGGEEVRLPALGESVTEGTITRWLKAVGEDIQVDEPLVEVSTDKVDTEIPSPVAGTVTQILVGEDATVEVGTVLAIVGGTAPAPAAPAPTAAAQPTPAASAAPAPATPAPAAPDAAPDYVPAHAQEPVDNLTPAQGAAAAADAVTGGGTYLTPLVRKLAAEHGVDVAQLTGSGVGGRIRKEDVLEAARQAQEAKQAASRAAQPAPVSGPAASVAPAAASSGTRKPTIPDVSPLRGTTEKQTRLRRLVASRMVEALHTQAQLTTVVEVDATRIAALRARAKDSFKAREGVNLTFLPFFTLAAVEALKAYPKINASITEEEIVYHGTENVGIAVDTPRGLVVPVIQEAGNLNLAGIARKIADLGARTRDNKVSPDELMGSTFTITNTGSGGALIDTPIVPVGQVAILGTGTIVKRPAVVKDADGNETIGIRSMCYLFLSYDHRLVDGADAARFLTTVKARIEEGAFESEVGL